MLYTPVHTSARGVAVQTPCMTTWRDTPELTDSRWAETLACIDIAKFKRSPPFPTLGTSPRSSTEFLEKLTNRQRRCELCRLGFDRSHTNTHMLGRPHAEMYALYKGHFDRIIEAQEKRHGMAQFNALTSHFRSHDEACWRGLLSAHRADVFDALRYRLLERYVRPNGEPLLFRDYLADFDRRMMREAIANAVALAVVRSSVCSAFESMASFRVACALAETSHSWVQDDIEHARRPVAQRQPILIQLLQEHTLAAHAVVALVMQYV